MPLLLPMTLLGLGLVGPAAVSTPESGSTEPTVERSLGAMGTSLGVRVWSTDRSAALSASEVAVRAIEAAEERLSTWGPVDEGGELLAALTRPAGSWVELSPALARDLVDAFAIARETDFAFDPAIASLVQAFDLRGAGRTPSPFELQAARSSSGARHFELEQRAGLPTRLRRTKRAAAIEEGGFGKGAGLRSALEAVAASEWARSIDRIELDLGGQIAFAQPNSTTNESALLSYAIADPRDRQHPLVAIDVTAGSLSTSGNSERGIVVDGIRHGHLIDPRTGLPAPDFGSVTVWSSDPLRADALSTALFVLGPTEAIDWARSRSDVEVVTIERRGEEPPIVCATPGVASRLRPLDDAVRLPHSLDAAGAEPPHSAQFPSPAR